MVELSTLKNAEAFSLPIRVYIEDTDAGGIVYYVNYLKYMERARSEWLRSLGKQHYSLAQENYQLVVHSCDIQYKKPAIMDDALTVTAQLIKKGKAYLLFKQEVLRDNVNGTELICTATIKVACVDSENLKPKKLPGVLGDL